MKRFLSAWEGYASLENLHTIELSKRASNNNRKIFKYFLHGALYLIGVIFVMTKPAYSTSINLNIESLTLEKAQYIDHLPFLSDYDLDSPKPLLIGDTVPKILWSLPLKVVNHVDGITSITLEAFKGQILLLDFLSSGCSSCMQALPHLEKVAKNFNEEATIITISSESAERMKKFLQHNDLISSLSMPFVVEDRILREYFPHKYISHVVWIDAAGVVRAFTGTSHVREFTLQALRDTGAPLEWPVKAEVTTFFNKPLIGLTGNIASLPNNAKRYILYSMITGYTEGVGGYQPTTQDSLYGIQRYSVRNRSILDMYLIAVDRLYKLSPEDIILEVDDPERFDLHRADLNKQTLEQWYRRNGVCYEGTFSLSATRSEIRSAMLADLNRFFGLYGRLDEREGKEKFILSNYNLKP